MFPGKPLNLSTKTCTCRHRKTSHWQAESSGAFFSSRPSCELDLILIYGTGFAHEWIVHMILAIDKASDNTIFFIENKHRARPTPEGNVFGDETSILKRLSGLSDPTSLNLKGEQWPWISNGTSAQAHLSDTHLPGGQLWQNHPSDYSLSPGVTACKLNPWLGGNNRSGRLNT